MKTQIKPIKIVNPKFRALLNNTTIIMTVVFITILSGCKSNSTEDDAKRGTELLCKLKAMEKGESKDIIAEANKLTNDIEEFKKYVENNYDEKERKKLGALIELGTKHCRNENESQSKNLESDNDKSDVSTDAEITKEVDKPIENQITCKFSTIGMHEGVAQIVFIKPDGSKIDFVHNYMKDQELPYMFLGEYGQGSNEEYVGKSFVIKWEQVKEQNDATGDYELVNKIVNISLQ